MTPQPTHCLVAVLTFGFNQFPIAVPLPKPEPKTQAERTQAQIETNQWMQAMGLRRQ